jgi:hypothetical protein
MYTHFPHRFLPLKCRRVTLPVRLLVQQHHHAIIIITTTKQETESTECCQLQSKVKSICVFIDNLGSGSFLPTRHSHFVFSFLFSLNCICLLLSCTLHAFTAGRHLPVVVVAVDVFHCKSLSCINQQSIRSGGSILHALAAGLVVKAADVTVAVTAVVVYAVAASVVEPLVGFSCEKRIDGLIVTKSGIKD